MPSNEATGATLTLKFYDAGSNALTFSQVQAIQNNKAGPGSGAYEADAFLDPITLRVIATTPMTDAGSLSFNLLAGQSVAFAINWPTAARGYGLVIIDNGGNGYSNSATVNFTYQAARDIKRRLDKALATRADYTRSSAFNTAYNAATNYLYTADQSADDAVKGAQGQLALDQLVVAYDLLLNEYGPAYAKAHQASTPPWLGVTIEDISNYQSDLNKLAAMAGPYAWVRIVFQSGDGPSAYSNAVNYAKSKGIKVLGLPVDSSADAGYTRAQYLQRFTNFLTAFPTVDVWEVGNEVNGEWLSSDIAGRLADAAAYCKSQGKKTYLTLFWQLNTAEKPYAMFNWIATNLSDSVRSNLDYVGFSQYQEQAPMGAAYDQVMKRLRVEFPFQQIGIGELGYWIEDQRYWWAFSTNVAAAKTNILEQYYKAAFGYAGANGGCFWWNFASGGPDYDFNLPGMTNIINDLKNYLLANTNGSVCPTNKIVQCASVWDFDLPTSAGYCTNTNVSVLVINTVTNGVCPRTITCTWLVSDTCGNTNTCSQTVTVMDIMPPMLTCASNKTVECGQAWDFDPPSAWDTCCSTNIALTILSTVTNGEGCLSWITRTWQATDCCSNSATCSQTVTDLDTTPPAITWHLTNVLVAADTNCQSLMPDVTGTNYIVAVDNCSSVTVMQSVATNVVLNLGTNEVVLWASDACSNVAYCTNYVLVVDQTPPTLICPSNMLVSADAGSCSASNVALGVPETADNCGVAGLTNDAPALFPVGVTHVTWTVTDISGNTNSCVQTVTVLDTELPTISCPSNLTAEVDAGQCSKSNVALGMPATTDNCGVVSLTNDAPALFPEGITYVTWIVTDANGNTNTCVQTVTVLDLKIGIELSGTNAIINSTNGVPGLRYCVLVSESLDLPLTNWTRLGTNVFDADGRFVFTNAVDHAVPRFFILQLQ